MQLCRAELELFEGDTVEGARGPEARFWLANLEGFTLPLLPDPFPLHIHRRWGRFPALEFSGFEGAEERN